MLSKIHLMNALKIALFYPGYLHSTFNIFPKASAVKVIAHE